MSFLRLLLFCAFSLRVSLSILQYGHAFQSPGDFTSAEYATISSTFPIFTVEKRHAPAVYGNASLPYPFQSNSIASSIGTARMIKALNSSVRVLMYWNSALHWNFYECEADVQPSWLLPSSHGLPVPSYNYSVPEFRTWWVSCAVGALRNSSGALDGLFIDAAPKLSWVGQPSNAYDLWGKMLDEVRKAVPGVFLIFNGDYYSQSGAVIANSTLLSHADAVYIESLANLIDDAKKNPPSTIIAYLRYLSSTAANLNPSKLFVGHGQCGNTSSSASQADPTFTFGLAIFLLVTPDPSTNYYISNFGYNIDQGVLFPHAEYALEFGKPLNDFTVNGFLLKRTFSNATVIVNLKTQTGEINMG
jgi:hypothetical protein